MYEVPTFGKNTGGSIAWGVGESKHVLLGMMAEGAVMRLREDTVCYAR